MSSTNETNIFLNQSGLTFYTQEFMAKYKAYLESLMVQTINEESSDSKLPTALAVFNAIQASLNSSNSPSFKVVTGELSSVESPVGTVIYLQRDDESDTTYEQFIYADDVWINIGTTEFTSDDYITRDELVPITNAEITQIIEDVFGTSS